MIVYRTYQSGDEKHIVQLWNKCLLNDPITLKRFCNLVLLDVNFDPTGLKLAFSKERLIGCVYAIRRLLPMYGTDLEEENGWIPFFFVHPKYEGKRIGTSLLEAAVQFLWDHNRKDIFFSSYAPNYILPGLDVTAYPRGKVFLEKNGFKKLYSPVAMDQNLVEYKEKKGIKSLKLEREVEGYTFESAQNKDLYELIHFATEKFNPDWGRAIREAILHGGQLENIFIVRKKGVLVGFCMHGAYEGIAERFGPFGIDTDEQGKGLGKILLHECLLSMKSKGLHNAWFLWTGEKTAAGYLYRKTGFNITRTFHVMKKTRVMSE
ncbi:MULTISPECIES: GNAT family N-acetyltransferase [unclassified Bacillus (in: firmicutes)]|uniref:GNAT family N-acetyltransferase n=1 Tax=unclassified Bacillus (in: firmicutes) TaxID=185979 RepID=UPI0004E0B73B|nr:MULTISPECIES: GNAT family N-acetyltransferase [unclassified Bacillus (in: firmicutes)]